MKRNEYAEPTEMAGIAEADTEMAYAWALDYDDPDEFPTQRLTPRRWFGAATRLSLLLRRCPRRAMWHGDQRVWLHH